MPEQKGAAGEEKQDLTIRAIHFALFPFVQHFGEYGRAFLLPGDDEARLLRIADVLDVTEDQHPALAKVLVKFAAGAEFGGQSCILYVHF